MGESPLTDLGPKEVAALVISSAWTIALVVGPVAFASVVAIVGLQTAQGGLVFATESIKPDLARLSPMQGLKRLGFSQNGIELLKAMAGATVLTVIGWQAVKTTLVDSVGLATVPSVPAAVVGWNGALGVLRKSAIALVVLAGIDYAVQRWRFMRSQRMTKQEVKDEHRLQEGSPEVKGRVRRIQREMVRRRMLAAVAKATVVVVNPTHYAVALEYHRAAMPAPRVVAKGRGFVALRIRELAREHGVPIVENPPLARALHKHAEVGDIIPAALFEAVAEVLAYLIRLRQLVL
jgi:flagellar biosynthetic protein FlhB